MESTIRIFKNIVRSIYSGTPPTEPVNTRAELHCIFSHVANILNSRPLSSQSEDTLALNSNQLVKPYISNADQEILVSKYLEEVFNDSDRHLLLSKIFQNNQSMARTASQVLKREFLENAKLFSDKPGGLSPLVGDVVLVLKDQPNLGLAVQVLSPRREDLSSVVQTDKFIRIKFTPGQLSQAAAVLGLEPSVAIKERLSSCLPSRCL